VELGKIKVFLSSKVKEHHLVFMKSSKTALQLIKCVTYITWVLSNVNEIKE
jgi:hypothetical protein